MGCFKVEVEVEVEMFGRGVCLARADPWRWANTLGCKLPGRCGPGRPPWGDRPGPLSTLSGLRLGMRNAFLISFFNAPATPRHHLWHEGSGHRAPC